ncbi:MAG: hypothetical protein AMS27_16010, partial [Bacteroides sp. SM23_62_1]
MMFRISSVPFLVNIIKRIDEGYSPRWIVFLVDMVIVVFSIMLAFLLRFNFVLTDDYRRYMYFGVLLVFLVRSSLSLIFKTYAHIIRHTSSLDIARLILSTSVGS